MGSALCVSLENDDLVTEGEDLRIFDPVTHGQKAEHFNTVVTPR
jgi:hypothetical protein